MRLERRKRGLGNATTQRTMARRRDSRVKVELEVVCDLSLDAELVRGFAPEVGAALCPHEGGDDERDDQGEEPAAGRLFAVGRVGLRGRPQRSVVVVQAG